MNELERYPLHRAAFFNDFRTLEFLIESGADLYEKDVHGNTALHISTMLGHKESIALLLAHNAPVKTKNTSGWSALMEAVAYGDRDIITTILRKLKSQARENLSARKPHLFKVLNEIGDFYLELKWDFHSWIPLVSRVLPSDICKIYKRGTALRMDTTLVDFNERTWERGDISFIYNPAAESINQHLVVLDNKSKVFQRIRKQETDTELDEEVDVLMSSDIVSASMSTKPITFERAFSGWIFKHEKSEQIGNFGANYYAVEGMSLITRKRREHLSMDDIKKNKTFMQNFTTGKAITDDDLKGLQHRKNLPPPGRTSTTWEDYVGAPPGYPPPLGRQQVLKVHTKAFKAMVAMSNEFPLEVSVLLDILEIVAPFKHFEKLRRFCEVRLPSGFPVRLEVPLLPTISAKVTFQRFEWRDDLTPKFFRIPKSYREDATRFPDL